MAFGFAALRILAAFANSAENIPRRLEPPPFVYITVHDATAAYVLAPASTIT